MKKQLESNKEFFIVVGIFLSFIVVSCYGVYRIAQQDQKQNREAKRAIGIAYPKDISIVASYSGDSPGSVDVISIPVDTSGDGNFDINATAPDIADDVHSFIKTENKTKKYQVHLIYEGKYGWKIEKVKRL